MTATFPHSLGPIRPAAMKKRYAAEFRFKLYGRIAIVIALIGGPFFLFLARRSV